LIDIDKKLSVQSDTEVLCFKFHAGTNYIHYHISPFNVFFNRIKIIGPGM